jgi:cell division protein FtsQ
VAVSGSAGLEAAQEELGEQPARASRRPQPRFWWSLLGTVLLCGLLLGLWFVSPVRRVTVAGNTHLSAAQVQKLAGLTPPFYATPHPGGWLYYGAWRAADLRRSPWIASAQIVKRFPGAVEITVTERVASARWQQPGGKVVGVAWDGTVLPGAVPRGPLLIGWGPDRLPLARAIASAFGRYTVESVQYTPSGLTVKTANGTVWSGNMDSLLKYSGSVKMFAGKHINIYPWGVSVQQ